MSLAEISSQVALEVIPKDHLIQDETRRKVIARSFICGSPATLPNIIPNLKLVISGYSNRLCILSALFVTLIEFH